MRTFIFFSLILVFYSCNNPQHSKKQEQETEQKESDSLALQRLTRNLYKWSFERKCFDFEPAKIAPNDTIYHSIDSLNHNACLDEMKATGFFSEDFIDIYDKIKQNIDLCLKDKTFEWIEGYMPPFGNGTDEWCLCQDSPTTDFYEHIIIKKVDFYENTATFIWTWGKGDFERDFEYRIKVKKENNQWKIASMEGFEILYEQIELQMQK